MDLKITTSPDGYALCSPVDPKDLAVFTHCVGGTCCLKEKVFTDDFSNLFLAHGVHEIKLVKAKKVKAKRDLGHTFNGDEICTKCGHSQTYAEWQKIKCFQSETVRFKKR